MSSSLKSVVLLSAGLDSSVNFLMSLRRTEVLLALTFDYGQRAAKQEIAHSQMLAEQYAVKHEIVELPWFKKITKTSLVNQSVEVPLSIDLNSQNQTENSAQKVWVPNRNGIFLNIAAGFAESLGAEIIVPGFNLEEASTFPDNSTEFIEATSRSLSFSTANHVRVECYTSKMNKIQIAELGRELGLDFNKVWSCYFGNQEPCGECESCLRFQRAVALV